MSQDLVTRERATWAKIATHLTPSDAWAMVRRRANAVGIETAIRCYTF
jgi:hypothetical protein